MYWPVGTPRIYATSSNRASGSNLYVSHDGLPTPNPDAGADAPPSPSRSPTKDDDEAQLATPMTPATPAIEPVEHAEHVDEESKTSTSRAPEANSVPLKDPILALRVSRTGQMFAVITATSITLWQTKVSNRAQVCCSKLMNSPPSSLPSSYGPNPPSTRTAAMSTFYSDPIPLFLSCALHKDTL